VSAYRAAAIVAVSGCVGLLGLVVLAAAAVLQVAR